MANEEMNISELSDKEIPSPKHKAPLWLQLGLALFYFFIIAYVSSLSSDDQGLDAISQTTEGIVLMKVLQVISVIIVFILPPVLFGFILRHDKLKFLSLNRIPKFLPFIIGFIICIVALPMVSGTAYWNAHIHLPESLQGIEHWMKLREETANKTIELFFVDKSLGGMFINLFVIAFMAGLSEEIFFRGFIQKLFVENKMNAHIAIWITAILFSAIHMQFFGFIPRMLLGAVLGYLYHYTNNLWVPITAHTVNNSFAVIMAYFTGSISDDPLGSGETNHINPSLVLLSGLLVAGLIYILFKKTRIQDSRGLN